LQIENSIQANEIANAADALQLQDGSNSGDSSNLKKSNESSKKESENGNEVVGEETSKIQLQRLLETQSSKQSNPKNRAISKKSQETSLKWVQRQRHN
jgi:hypothetical protein